MKSCVCLLRKYRNVEEYVGYFYVFNVVFYLFVKRKKERKRKQEWAQVSHRIFIGSAERRLFFALSFMRFWFIEN